MFVLVTGLPGRLPEGWREVIDALGIPVVAKPGGITGVSHIVAEMAADLQLQPPPHEAAN